MLTRVLRTVRLDTIDRRSQVGVALRRVQEDLTAQLGGPAEVTAAQALLIEQAAIKAVIVQAVGEWILQQECPVNNDRQALIAVVMQHDVLQRGLAKLLETLGLEQRCARRGHPAPARPRLSRRGRTPAHRPRQRPYARRGTGS
jgi:hypothetical protein